MEVQLQLVGEWSADSAKRTDGNGQRKVILEVGPRAGGNVAHHGRVEQAKETQASEKGQAAPGARKGRDTSKWQAWPVTVSPKGKRMR